MGCLMRVQAPGRITRGSGDPRPERAGVLGLSFLQPARLVSLHKTVYPLAVNG